MNAEAATDTKGAKEIRLVGCWRRGQRRGSRCMVRTNRVQRRQRIGRTKHGRLRMIRLLLLSIECVLLLLLLLLWLELLLIMGCRCGRGRDARTNCRPHSDNKLGTNHVCGCGCACGRGLGRFFLK